MGISYHCNLATVREARGGREEDGGKTGCAEGGGRCRERRGKEWVAFVSAREKYRKNSLLPFLAKLTPTNSLSGTEEEGTEKNQTQATGSSSAFFVSLWELDTMLVDR